MTTTKDLSFITENFPFSKEKEEFVKQYQKKQEEEQKEYNRWVKENHYKSEKSGVPKYLWNESLDTYKVINNDDVIRLQEVKRFAYQDNNAGVLILCGDFEKGKDHLGSGLIYERGGVMISMIDLINEYKSSCRYYSKISVMDFYKKYLSQPMLVINEIDTTKYNAEENRILQYLIKKRHENLVPTCLITNLSKYLFEKAFEKEFLDKLDEIGIFLSSRTCNS